MLLRACILALTLPLLLAGCSGETASEDAQYADKMAEEHKDDTPDPGPATEGEPAASIDTSTVTYATVDGTDVQGYLARPQGAPADAPAMIVIHEWWGLNDNIRAMADKLAGEGYVALAVDLYSGVVAEDRETARETMMSAMENSALLEENLRQAHAYLEQQGSSQVGSIGWCFGGGWSLNTALLLPEQLDAAVIYYGRLVTEKEELAALEAPVLGIFGDLDQGIPLEMVEAFKTSLEELGKDAQIHIYEGADHAFANPSGTRYKADAAEDAWAKTLAFLDAHLRG